MDSIAKVLSNRGLLNRPRLPPSIIWIPAALVAAAVILPLVYLVVRTLGTGTEAWDLLLRVRVLETIGRTMLLALAVTVASIVIAVPLAWLTVRTDLPFRRVWSVLTVLPLVIPSYVGGLVMITALGPRGMLQDYVAGPLFGIERLPETYGFPGSLLVLALLSYPYVTLSVRGAMWGLDQSLEETSRNLGQGSLSTFLRVVLPQLRPGIAAGALLVALYTLSDFGAVSLLGYETFTYVIYLQYEAGARTLASASSLVLRRSSPGDTILRGEYSRSYQILSEHGWDWAARSLPYTWASGAGLPPFFCGTLILFSLVMPIGVLGYWLGRGIHSGESLGLTWSVIGNSVYVSGIAAGVAVLAALPVAILSVRYASKVSAMMERISYIGFALPGIVIALALVFFGANYATPLYRTLGLLILAYVVLFLPAALGAVRASLLQVNPRVEEAARGLGKRPFQVFKSVTVPLMRPGILAGTALVFLVTMKELPATLILGPYRIQDPGHVGLVCDGGSLFHPGRSAGPSPYFGLLRTHGLTDASRWETPPLKSPHGLVEGTLTQLLIEVE